MSVLYIVKMPNMRIVYDMGRIWLYPIFLTLYRICKTLIML